MSFQNNHPLDDDLVAVRLSNVLSSVDPDDTDKLNEMILNFNTSEADMQKAVVSDEMTRDILVKMKKYHAMTDLIGQMNEAHNANAYAREILDQEQERLTRLSFNARKEVYKTQQMYLAIAFARKHMRFLTGVMLFTMAATAGLAVLVAFFLQGWINDVIFGIAAAVAVAAYIVVIVAAFAFEARRRSYHWKQFHWSVKTNVKHALDKDTLDRSVGSCKKK